MSQRGKSMETGSRPLGTRDWGDGNEEWLLGEGGSIFHGDENVLKSVLVLVIQACGCTRTTELCTFNGRIVWPISMHVCSVMSLCDPMDRSRPGSSVHGIFQARILEWFAISFSRGSSNPGIALQGDSLPSEVPGKPLKSLMYSQLKYQMLQC